MVNSMWFWHSIVGVGLSMIASMGRSPRCVAQMALKAVLLFAVIAGFTQADAQTSSATATAASEVDANTPVFFTGAIFSDKTRDPVVSPGQVFALSVQAETNKPVGSAYLQQRLEVLVDGLKATPVTSSPQSGLTGLNPSASLPLTTHRLSLLLRAPDIPLSPGSARKATLALVDGANGQILDTALLNLVSDSTSAELSSPLFSERGIQIASYAAAASIVLSVYWIVMFRRQRARADKAASELAAIRFNDRTAEWSNSVPFPREEPVELIVPGELESELQTGEMLLFVGSHLGEVVGEPTFADVLRRLTSVSSVNEEESQLINRSITRGDLVRAADLIARKSGQVAIVQELQRIYIGSHVGSKGESRSMGGLPQIYQTLANLPFAGVLTTTWTDQVDRAFASRQPEIFSPHSKSTLDVIQAGRFFVLHMWGLLGGETPPLLGRDQIVAAQRQGSLYSRFLQSLIGSRSVLFVGASPSDIEWVLSQASGGSSPRYFAFIPTFMLTTQARLVSELLHERFGVITTPYPPTNGDTNLVDALRNMQKSVGSRRMAPPQLSVRRHLTGLSLTNIGPFKQLSVDFKQDWNVLLGDNACGKSTILRAVALGLCGDTPQAAEPGVSLLRAGADEGRIELQVGQEVFVTSLFREQDGVRLTSSGLTPLQRGGWVVLGFPPIRGVWLKRGERTVVSANDRRPKAADLLPLLAGGVDSRVDDLCIWINAIGTTQRGQQLLRSFFDVLRELAPTEELRLSKVDSNGKVWVETNDGVVPIEMLSQGMSSTIGWVGTLLQRMYEIYPESEHPEAEPALILVDEIDAHLHPAWQRSLVGLAQKHFKGLQVIATTHSPLVVGSMKSDDVIVVRRDPVDRNAISISRGTDEVTLEGMRADQILTSSLFGMQSTRSEKDSLALRRYAGLLGMATRTSEQEKEFSELQARVQGWGGGTSKVDLPEPDSEDASSTLASENHGHALEKLRAFMHNGSKQ